jgi:hypothetical protein
VHVGGTCTGRHGGAVGSGLQALRQLHELMARDSR